MYATLFVAPFCFRSYAGADKREREKKGNFPQVVYRLARLASGAKDGSKEDEEELD